MAGDPVQPGRQRVIYPDGAALPCEDEERCLKRVQGVFLVSEDPLAGAQYRPTMASHQDRECELGLVTWLRGEPLQELAVGQGTDGPNLKEPSYRTQLRLPPLTRHASLSSALAHPDI